MDNTEKTKFEKMELVMRKHDYFKRALNRLENVYIGETKSPVEDLAIIFRAEFKTMIEQIGEKIQKEFNEIMGE